MFDALYGTPAAPDGALPPMADSIPFRRRRVWLHQSVLDWMADASSPTQLTQRARLVLWQMFAQGAPTQVKSVRGAGAGWLRSDLGGNHGHQFYLWWARGGSRPMRDRGFDRDEVHVRAVRHHDETSDALDPGDRDAWLPLSATDLGELDLAPALLPAQQEAVASRGRARLIRGQPGTGKTTVLSHTALLDGSRTALYLTYSARLADRARAYFREFAPPSADITVMTFAELYAALGESAVVHDDLASQQRRLVDALAGYPHRHAPWEGHPEALHAELYAFFAGAALPESFRGAPAVGASGFRVEDYAALRKAAVGERAATTAARVGRWLADEGLLPALAPGPSAARRILDAGFTLPASLRDVTSVFVDEAQDLSRVESWLLVEVVAAMGDGARLVVAADEGQTVRPTDFDWGHFSDVVARRFASPVRHDLTGNVRSPRALVSVVQRTLDLYHQLAKDQRPRGRSLDAAEEVVSGRVIRCRVRDGEFARLAAALDELPGTALVHPGAEAPTSLRATGVETFSADAAKGLDFSVVAVLGAGAYIAGLRAEATQAGSDPWHVALARSMTDQLRVAVSRATDTLIFVERDGDPGDVEVDRLCRGDDGEYADGFLQRMDVDEVIALLERPDATAEELVQEFLDDVRTSLREHPRRALDRARRARGLLGRADSRVGVTDLSLRAAAMRAQGVAALHLALTGSSGDVELRELFDESARAFRGARVTVAERGARALRDLRLKAGDSADDARWLVDNLAALGDEAPECADGAREALRQWCARCETATLPEGSTARVKLVAAVECVDDAPPDVVDRVRLRVSGALLAADDAERALQVLRRMRAPAAREEGRCLEKLGRWSEAADRYESVGATGDALRCARRQPDVPRALRLAEAHESDAADALRWLRDALAAVEDGAAHTASLTDEELAHTRERLERVFGSASRTGRWRRMG